MALTYNVVNAQSYMYRRGLAALSVGVSVPAYSFGNHTGTDIHSYVNYGASVVGEAAYFYSKHVGFNFLVYYNVNTIDDAKLANSYLTSSSAYQSVSAKTEPFRELSGFAGFVFDIPATEYLSFVFKMMAGLRGVHKPTALIKTTTVFSTIDYYETSDNQVAFALYSSMGGRIVISEQLNLNLNVSYVGSTIDFEFFRNSTPVTENVHVGILQFMGGVSYSF